MSKNTNFPHIIDVEASGFGPESYPIEVGVIKSCGERYCTLIQPHERWSHWSKDAEELHGISRATLLKKGKAIRDVCFELNEFLGNDHVFTDAWSHDEAWLSRLYRRARIHPSFSVRAIEFILEEDQLLLWDHTKEIIAAKSSFPRHRASNDAYVIQQTFIACKNQIN